MPGIWLAFTELSLIRALVEGGPFLLGEMFGGVFALLAALVGICFGLCGFPVFLLYWWWRRRQPTVLLTVTESGKFTYAKRCNGMNVEQGEFVASEMTLEAVHGAERGIRAWDGTTEVFFVARGHSNERLDRAVDEIYATIAELPPSPALID